MPSTYKTSYLSLNYWSGEDKPKRDDFNYDNRAVDTAYQQLASAQEGQGNLLAEYEKQLRAVSEQVTGPVTARLDALDTGLKTIDGRIDTVSGRTDAVDARSQGTESSLQQHLTASGHITDAERQKWNAAGNGSAPHIVTYSGNGAMTRAVEAGFRPSHGFVFSAGQPIFSFAPGSGVWQSYSGAFSGNGCTDGIEMSSSGIHVYQDASWGDDGYQICLNQQGRNYVVLFWR